MINTQSMYRFELFLSLGIGLALSFIVNWWGASAAIDPFWHRTANNRDSQTAAMFNIDSTQDEVDANPGDGLCTTLTNKCTLRAAIQEANELRGRDTILIPPGTYSLTISGPEEDSAMTGDLDITTSMIIMGSGADDTLIDGGDLDRVIHIPISSAVVTISNVTIQNGYLGMASSGGGIKNLGTLTLVSSVITHNFVGDMSVGGGISNGGTMTVTNSIVSNNSAYGIGGIQNYGEMLIYTSTIKINSSSIQSGGIGNDLGTLAIVDSTISENSSLSAGGIQNSATLLISNSTISGNTSLSSGAGIYNSSGRIDLNYVTITNNVADVDVGGIAGDGGGIRISSGVVNIKNTILAGNHDDNQGGDIHPDCSGVLNSQGYNLIQNVQGCSVDGNTDGNLIGVDPRLGSLQDNGGPTLTHALLASSAAINTGNNVDCPKTDQRGMLRPVGEVCDIGSYESESIPRVFIPCIVNKYCSPLFTDYFSDPASGWPIDDSGDILYEYLNDEYRILVRSVSMSAGARPGFIASDYIVTVDVRNVTGVEGSYGIIFGLSDDWTQFYTFEIESNGSYTIWRYVSADGWTPLASGTSSYINPGTATNRIKVERSGALIEVYSNEQLLTSVSDSIYTGSGHIGLIVSTFDQPDVDIRFDNLTVYPMTCGWSNNSPGSGSEPHKAYVFQFDLTMVWERDHQFTKQK